MIATDPRPLAGPSLFGPWSRYGLAILTAIAAFGIYRALTAWVGPGLPTYVIFYPGVMLVAMLTGPGPGMLATVLSVLLVDLWILPPIGQFQVESPADRLGMVLFTGCGVLLSVFAEFYRHNRRKAAIYDQELVLLEIRKDKAFLAEILEHASQPFAVGYPDGRVGTFNQAFVDLTGYTVQELRHANWSETLTPPEWREPERLQIEELNHTGCPVRYEKEYLTKDGRRIPLELLVHLVRDAEGRPDYYYAFLTDITEHKRVEGLLQRYELLAHHTRDIVLFVELETGRIREANQAAEKAYGYSREELLRLSIQELRAPDTRPLTAEQMAQANTGGFLFETTHLRKDGSVFPVEVSSLGATIGGVQTLLSVIRDSTRRKQAEAALQESEATLRAILDATQESIFLFDMDGTILAANRTALQRLGTSTQEAIGTHFSRFLDPEMAVARAAQLAKVIETGTALNYEDERAGILFDHTCYPIPDAGGQIHRVATFSRNITEARRAEAALKRTNARSKLLADSARALLSTEERQSALESLCRRVLEFLDCQVFFNYIADKEQGGLHLNASAGIPVEEALGFEWLPCDTTDCGCSELDICASPVEDLVQRRDAWHSWLSSCGIQAWSHHQLLVEGRVMGLLTFGTRHRATFCEEDLSLMKAVADQVSLAMQRIHSKQILQDMNTELESTIGKLALTSQELQVVNTELIAGNLLLEQRVADRTQELHTRMLQLQVLAGQLNRAEEEERRRIAQIIHDHLQQLLVAARLRVDTLAIRAKGGILESSLQALYIILTESIQVARSLTAELYPSVLHREGLTAALVWLAGWYEREHGLSVQVDSDQQAELPESEMRILVFRAVRELLFNVVKHAGVGSARVCISHPETNSVRIEVMDEGKGFDPETAGIENGSRVGLGLFSLRERMELFGGKLEVLSAPGQGSRFTITAPIVLPSLPVRHQEATPAALVAELQPQPIGRPSKIRILLADDHAVVREGMAQVLKEEPGFEVVGQASNGLEALEEARRLLPDIIVMDVSMPVMNGIEATRRILAELPQIKILGLSMYDDEAHAEVMREAGALDFLDKGGPIAILKAKVRRVAGLEKPVA